MIPMQTAPIAPFITTYFRDHLVGVRNMSPNTLASYRDAMKLLIQFICREMDRPVTELTIQDINTARVLSFLAYLESERENSVRTRNHRLAAIRAFMIYVASTEPQLAGLCQNITSIPCKKGPRAVIDYLEREELETVFEEVDLKTDEGLRDFALLQLIYNSGARVQETADLHSSNLTLSKPYRVSILGKGRKWRTCPLWESTSKALQDYLSSRSQDSKEGHVFLNRYGKPLGRHGISYILKKYVRRAAVKMPQLLTKRISPHTLRHTTAMHLLQSGVEMNVIKSWLGHANLETTQQYVQFDLAMKTKAMAQCEGSYQEMGGQTVLPSWKAKPDILAWLRSL